MWLDRTKIPEEVKGLKRPIYLGQANGFGVFFDWRRKQTFRLPTNTFVLCTGLPTKADAKTEPKCHSNQHSAGSQPNSTPQP
jgi:hypothetical protein